MCKASLIPPKQPVLSIFVWSAEATQLIVMRYSIIEIDNEPMSCANLGGIECSFFWSKREV